MKNLKKSLSLKLAVLLVAVSCLSAFSVTALADDVTWEFDEATATLYIYGSGDMDDYSDPSSVPWYSKSLLVENVVVEDGVTSVGDYAFSGETSLTSVTLPDSVTSIGAYSFSSCTSLTSLTLSEYVTSISDISFAYDGTDLKTDFTLNAEAGTYALWYAYKNSVNFNCDSVLCGEHTVNISVKGGMRAVYPYTAKVDGTFTFSSSGNNDTLGYLYDSSFNRLAYDDDSGSSTNFSLTYDLTEGETYYIVTYLYNTSIISSYTMTISATNYTVSGTVNAMLNRSGEASGFVLDGAVINGETTDGTFSETVTDSNQTLTVSYLNAEYTLTFSPDDGGEIVIPLMACDVNCDGCVNAKDYSIMLNTDCEYISVFINFINYKVNN